MSEIRFTVRQVGGMTRIYAEDELVIGLSSDHPVTDALTCMVDSHEDCVEVLKRTQLFLMSKARRDPRERSIVKQITAALTLALPPMDSKRG